MAKWQTVPFEQLYAEPSKNGLTRPKRVRGTGYKMVNMGEIFAYDRIRNPVMDLVPMNESETTKYSLKPGDLLFARQSLVAAGAGKCSIVLETPEITTFESHLIRIKLDSKNAVPLFYYYYFSSPTGKGNVQSLVMQVAAAGIRGSELAKLPVPHPPLPIQRKIAAILSAYDDLIENNTRRIEILEEMARSLYREWFVNFRFPGHEQVKMVNSELGLIPEVGR
jgi:type I restriction enzyme S subunit